VADIDHYRTCVETLIKQHGRLSSAEEELETQWIFDREHHHYQLAYLGWQGNARICGPVLHFDIKQGKIWIQHNGTEFDVAEELMAMGVPRGDIVVGFHPPYKRKYTGFAME